MCWRAHDRRETPRICIVEYDMILNAGRDSQMLDNDACRSLH
jgi:hypothetical protein